LITVEVLNDLRLSFKEALLFDHHGLLGRAFPFFAAGDQRGANKRGCRHNGTAKKFGGKLHL
jgi:hypothetical protein